MKFQSRQYKGNLFQNPTDAFDDFPKTESSGVGYLMAETAIRLARSKAPRVQMHVDLWRHKLNISVGGFGVEKTLHHSTNDGLMDNLLLRMGLEINREVFIGGLSDPKNTIMPIFNAMSGTLVPAALWFLLFYQGLRQLSMVSWSPSPFPCGLKKILIPVLSKMQKFSIV